MVWLPKRTIKVSKLVPIAILIFLSITLKAQNTFNFDGQLSGVANWSPEAESWGLLNGRYLPELNYDWKLDTTHSWYFEASANIWGSTYFYNDSITTDGNVSPYRIWTRFSGKNYEVRLGLQKIDFGSAMILRPLLTEFLINLMLMSSLPSTLPIEWTTLAINQRLLLRN